LFAWGTGSFGTNASNSTVNISSPTQVYGEDNFWSQIACEIAIRTDGSAWSWGTNYYGQVGDSTLINRSSPVIIGGQSYDWLKLSTGDGGLTGAAIKSDYSLWMWGENSSGQYGNGNTTSKYSPIQVNTTSWTSVDLGEGNTTAAIKKIDNSLWLWGDGTVGQLGDNTSTTKSSPVQINFWWVLDTSCWWKIPFYWTEI